MATAAVNGTNRARNSLPEWVETTPTSHGITAPPRLPQANTGPLALREESANHSGKSETLIGKIEARPSPAKNAPGSTSAMPRALNKIIPPISAHARPAFATDVDRRP